MSKKNPKSKAKTRSFQSDIVIDEDGEVFISFFGPELLHLIDIRKNELQAITPWSPPALDQTNQVTILEGIRKEYANCLMCPKQCGFDRVRSAHPNCGDWQLKASDFGISFGDEAEISNGGGSGVIFISGCPLTCPSCINGEKVRNDGNIVSIEEFLGMVEKLHQKGVNNIQILSPSVNLPHLRVILKTLKESAFPIPVILKSSGYESAPELAKLKGTVDIYIPDYKFSTSCYWKKQSGADNYQEVFEACLAEMYAQTGPVVRNENDNVKRGVIIRHVKNPYLSETENKKIADFLNTRPDDIIISILDNFVVLE